jgi:N-acetylmuramoyl-L-alanine amidase
VINIDQVPLPAKILQYFKWNNQLTRSRKQKIFIDGQRQQEGQMKVVLDPGHGGTAEVGGSSHNNATGPTGLLEKSVTLDVALMAQLYLGGLGVDCVLTRSTDVNLGLEARARVAKDIGADAFVSIHFNGSVGHDAQGSETWQHRQASAASKSLAATVQAAVVAATGLRDRGVWDGGLAVTRPDYHAARTGACLVEISFMDRADEESRLRQANYKDRIARALAQAVHGWLVANGRTAAGKTTLFDFDEQHIVVPRLPEDGYEALNGVEAAGVDSMSLEAESCRAMGRIFADGMALAGDPLILGQKVPAATEVATCGAIAKKIRRTDAEFAQLVTNDNAQIIYKDEETTGADAVMSTRLKQKLDALATAVATEWPNVKLRITEAWDEDDEHAGNSLHYEGRAADLTTAPVDAAKLGRLGRLAVDAGCDWVWYENAAHVHVSVKK